MIVIGYSAEMPMSANPLNSGIKNINLTWNDPYLADPAMLPKWPNIKIRALKFLFTENGNNDKSGK